MIRNVFNEGHREMHLFDGLYLAADMIKCMLIFFTAIIVTFSKGPKNSSDLDYRKLGLVGKVRNQGSCNNGWIFALIGDIEGQYAKKRGDFVDFSAQELIDCLYQCPRCYYCDTTVALNSLISLGGIERDEDYPIVKGHQHCQYKPAISRVSVVNYNIHRPANEDQMIKLLEHYGPLYISIDGNELQGYTRGILDQCPYNERNHAVLLIGYGTEDGVDYWLIKNSLGTSWGQQGFGKIRRNVNACGIMNNSVFTLVIRDNNL